jgi:predicted permease
MSGNGPFGGSRTTSSFEVQGFGHGREERLRTREEAVTPDYFRTVGLRIVRGRGFEPSDAGSGRRVSVINETIARHYFGGQDPIGRRWAYDPDFGPDSFEIVGVVSDARYNDLKGESPNMAYRPIAQTDWYPQSLEIKAVGDPAGLVTTLASVLRQVEPKLPVARVETLDSRVSRSMGQERMLTYLTGAFGLTALALACLGLYGTISFAVTRRTTELGVRMALGADRGAVRRLIMSEALTLVLLGLGVGLPLAFVGARALKSVLFGVTALDLPSYGIAVAVLLTIATLAAYLPARRASRLDPVSALRAE